MEKRQVSDYTQKKYIQISSSSSQNGICVEQSQIQSKLYCYEDVLRFRKIYLSNSLKTKQLQYDNFIQNKLLNVLFVFGPSGCGKSLLVEEKLKVSGICYYHREQVQILVNEKQNQGEGVGFELGFIPLKDVIIQALDTKNSSYVDLFHDFPISHGSHSNLEQFKTLIYQKISKTTAKVIFILNSQIYSPFYVLNQNNSLFKLSSLPNVKVIEFNEYSKTQIKYLLNHFIRLKPQYEKVQSRINEIAEFCNGDARRALSDLYWSTLSLPNSSKNHRGEKVRLFHLIGKYLYAKRLNINNNKAQYFPQKYLKDNDPPFYFDPIETFLKSRVDLSIFHDLLQQNYVRRFYSIQDIVKFNNVLALIDSNFSKFQMNRANEANNNNNQDIICALLTWGSILCNLNSGLIKQKGLFQFKKNEYKSIDKQRRNRKYLIQCYFPNFNIRDLVKFAHLNRENTKNTHDVCRILAKRVITRLNNLQQSANVLTEKDQNNYQISYGLTKTEQFLRNKMRDHEIFIKMIEKSEMQECGSEIESSDQDEAEKLKLNEKLQYHKIREYLNKQQ